MPLELLVDGDRFCSYEGFVEEFNRAQLAAPGLPPWNGEISDLHDLLEAAQETAGRPLTLRWLNSQKSSSDLGHAAMSEYWRRHLASIPQGVFSPDGYQLVHGWSQERLDAAEAGQGRTLFEWLVWQLRGETDDLVEGDGLIDLRLE